MSQIPSSLSPPVVDVLRRAREMVADGKNSTSEVAGLVGDIGRLSDTDRKDLFDTFEGVKTQAGAPKDKEALEVFLTALRGKPAKLLDKLEKDDGIVDLKDALAVLSEVGKGSGVSGKQRVSVFAALLAARTTPDAKAALANFSTNRSIDIDHAMRELLRRGNVTADEVRALKVGAGDHPYDTYQLSYWAQTTKRSDYAAGGFEAMQAAAEETYRHVGVHYKEDLELNRGRPCTLRGSHVLNLFSRETLSLPWPVSFDAGRYKLDVGGSVQHYDKPDVLAAFLIENALKRGGHDIDSVRWDPADGGRYVVKKGAAESRHTYHVDVLRAFGYRI